MKFNVRAIICLLVCIIVGQNISAQCDATDIECVTLPGFINSDPDVCGAFVELENPTSLTSGCPIMSTINDFNGTTSAFDTYPVGVTNVVFTVTFDNGDTAECTTTVFINDNENPVIMYPEITANQCSSDAVPIYETFDDLIADGGMVTDNCDIDEDSWTFISETESSTTCPIIITRSYSIMDVNTGTAILAQSFIINDVTNPSIECPEDLEVTVNDVCEAEVEIPLVSSDDNCGIVSTTNNINGTEDASGIFDAGFYEIEYTVEDACGNTATCSFDLDVIDDMAPMFTIDPPSIENVSCNDPLPEQEELLPNDVVDNCLTTIISMAIDSIPVPCEDYPINYYWIAEDLSGNADTLTATFIRERDNEIPVIDPATTLEDLGPFACDEDFPPFQEVFAIDNCGAAIVETSISDFTPDLCNGYDVTYNWTPIDDCGNVGDPVSVTFNVEGDNEPPTINLTDVELTFCNDPNTCHAELILENPDVSGGCSEVTSVSYSPNITTFEIGTTIITWTVENECGLTSTIDQSIVVQDCEGPAIVCNGDLQIVLNEMGEAEIDVSQIILDAEDLCTGPVDLTLQVMTDVGCDDTGDDQTVNVCCGNLNIETMILGTATDHADPTNSTICMVMVSVVTPTPTIEECLPDVTVSCDYEFDLSNLFEFGTLVGDPTDATTIEIDDELADPVSYEDGLYASACGDQIVLESIEDLRECNQGEIIRTLTIEGEESVSCYHTITIVDDTPFSLDDIEWPEDVTIEGCVSTPGNTPEPTYVSDNCASIGVSMEDVVFQDPNSGCTIINRLWTIIDWCQYIPNSDSPEGIFSYTQTIYFEDTVAPNITNCQDTLICVAYNACQAMVDLSAFVTDNCTDEEDIEISYMVDLESDGSVDFAGVGNNFIDTLDFGVHTIQWVAHDKCGNRDTCNIVFETKDCKAPTAACKFGIAGNLGLMIIGGDTLPLLMVEPEIFDASSYDLCTPTDDLIFSFSTDILDTLLTFTCDSIGIRKVDVYVTDAAGNQSFCITHIDVQDNFELCPDLPGEEETEEVTEEDVETLPEVFVSGSLYNENYEPLSNVEMRLNGEGSSLTNEDGEYMFDALEMYHNYAVSAKRDSHYLNGVSTLDIVVIQRHLLGLENIDSPYKIIAADVNKSNSLSALDLSEIRKLILGVNDEFENTDSWVFVDAQQHFLDNSNPWEFNEQMELADLDHDAPGMDFIAIKMGDVDNSADLSFGQQTENRGAVKKIQLRDSAEGLNFNAAFDMSSYGFQMTIDVTGQDMNNFVFTSDIIKNENIYLELHPHKSVISISVALINPIDIKKGMTLFTIDGAVSPNTKINSSITKSEIYDNYFDAYSISSQGNAIIDSPIIINNCTPNPFSERSELSFNLKEEQWITLEIVDINGRQIFRSSSYYVQGSNTIIVDDNKLNETKGILIVRLSNGQYMETHKLIRL